MKTIEHILILSLIIFIYSCGKGSVEVENTSYRPKIVIDGYLVPHHKVKNIRITRNFKINENLNNFSLIPEVNNTTVTITDLQTDIVYPLSFHRAPEQDRRLENYYWEYNGDDLLIEYGQRYQLNVTTIIDGKELQASSITKIPEDGFEIININYTELKYREQDENNQSKHFMLTINRAPGTTFYVNTIQALNPSKYNYIYNNPYSNPDSSEVEEDLVDWSYTYDWTQDTPETAGYTNVQMFWPYFNFYDDYQIITMACDINYKEFLQTYDSVQEEDGNFHEAKYNIQGDGIGVFGSVVMDTLYVKVTK
ncbi:MAG: DUF4249 family protein [Calditrichaceae bacterium]|nr:DUF4249 family protein [Calditrichaceae bacterium]